MEALTTVSEVFDRFGATQIAKVCGVQYRTAYNWLPREKFPPKTTLIPLQKFFESKGCTAPLSLWGIEEAP